MKHGFYEASITLGVALFLGSGAVLADDATDGSGQIANSLNTTAGGGITTVGNTDGVTLNSDTEVKGNITAGSANITGNISGGSANITNDASVGGNFSATGTTNQIGTTSNSNNTISGNSTTINSTNNTISGQKATIIGTTSVTATSVNSTLELQPNSAQTTVKEPGTGLRQSQMSLGNVGEQGARVDANGKITMGKLDQSTAALTVTNGQGNTHGFVVNESSATMSGGATSLTLDDGSARFSNASTGGPVRVTGVADGRSDYDAVNYRQLKSVKAGIAGIAAMTNIPLVEQYKKFALGVGVGHYDGMTSMALGVSARISENAIIKASVSNGVAGGSTRKSTVYGIGAGFSW
jgi:hypothetical protein